MTDDGTVHSGAAALTLLESLMVHLADQGSLSEEDLEIIYSAAVGAQTAAYEETGDPGHRAAAEILTKLQARSDSVRRI